MKRKGYWKGKARAHRYAVLMREGATKSDARYYSGSRFRMACWYEIRAFAVDFYAEFDRSIWGDKAAPPTELGGLSSIIGAET